MRFGAAVAGIKCTRLGGSAGTPKRSEVEALIAENRLPAADVKAVDPWWFGTASEPLFGNRVRRVGHTIGLGHLGLPRIMYACAFGNQLPLKATTPQAHRSLPAPFATCDRPGI